MNRQGRNKMYCVAKNARSKYCFNLKSPLISCFFFFCDSIYMEYICVNARYVH